MSDYIKREDATAVISKTLGSLGNSVITEINSLPGYATQDYARVTQESTQDLISGQDAIALVIKAIHGTDNKEIQEYLFDGLRKQMWSLPSADRPTGRWVPTSEGLPDFGDTFLVTVMVGAKRETDVASSFGSYIDGFWDTFTDWIEDEECHVVAWMPMPEPYREDGEEE